MVRMMGRECRRALCQGPRVGYRRCGVSREMMVAVKKPCMAARVGARNGQYSCMRNAANQSNRANASDGAGRLPWYVDITVQWNLRMTTRRWFVTFSDRKQSLV